MENLWDFSGFITNLLQYLSLYVLLVLFLWIIQNNIYGLNRISDGKRKRFGGRCGWVELHREALKSH